MLKILQAGMYTSIQDLGRIGYRNIGVPISGAMDSISAAFANALLNNKANDAVLEITISGPKLEFTTGTNIIITGAEMSAKINSKSVLNNKIYEVTRGDVLSFGKLNYGARSYLAISGGFQTATVLKSRSFYSGITTQGTVKKNDLIPFKNKKIGQSKQVGKLKSRASFFEANTIEVYRGPEYELFELKEQKKLVSGKFTVSIKNNRMGYNFEEKVIPHNKSIITSPVLPGTIQLLPSGRIIILMKDAQTTGGYPRVLQMTDMAQSILAQKKAGDIISFKLIDYP